MGAWLVPIAFEGPAAHRRVRCTMRETGHCGGCRPDSGMDCRYECLYVCSRCGGMEGSLLPFCPDRALAYEEDSRNYDHYCQATGPFARATMATVGPALDVAAMNFVDTGLPTSRLTGALRFLLAMCDLYDLVIEQTRRGA